MGGGAEAPGRTERQRGLVAASPSKFRGARQDDSKRRDSPAAVITQRLGRALLRMESPWQGRAVAGRVSRTRGLSSRSWWARGPRMSPDRLVGTRTWALRPCRGWGRRWRVSVFVELGEQEARG